MWNAALWMFGRIVFFWRSPKLTEHDIDRCYQCLSRYPFAIIGLGSRRFVTGAFLPRGKHDAEHTEVWIGDGTCVGALMPRIRAISLRRLLRQYDSVTVVVFPLAQCPYRAVTFAIKNIDRRYDSLFDGSRGLLYCHEFGACCIEESGVKVKRSVPFVVFDDLANAGEVVLEIHR